MAPVNRHEIKSAVDQPRSVDPAKIGPVLRWVGGKTRLINRLLEKLPEDFERRKFYEPFMGSGAMFFAIQPPCAVLGDANPDLIHFYTTLANAPNQLNSLLLRHVRRHSEGYYIAVRNHFNRERRGATSIAQAARFLYLNRACWNGVYRVNRLGHFNVPYGHKDPLPIPSKDRLVRASSLLTRAELYCRDFESIIDNADKDSLVFLDPPYPPKSTTAYFHHYTPQRFDWDDHKRLANTIRLMSKNGARVMITVPDLSEIRHLYRKYCFSQNSLYRLISCKSDRRRVRELIITNYEVPR